jgi:hypothetical protein
LFIVICSNSRSQDAIAGIECVLVCTTATQLV